MCSLSNSEKQCAIQLIHPPLFAERCVYCMSAAVISAVFCFWYVRYFILYWIYNSGACRNVYICTRALVANPQTELWSWHERERFAYSIYGNQVQWSLFFSQYFINRLIIMFSVQAAFSFGFFSLFLTIITDKNFIIWCLTRNLFAEKR